LVQPKYYPGIFLEVLKKINLSPLQYESRSLLLHQSIRSHHSTEVNLMEERVSVVSKALFYPGVGGCTFLRNVSNDLPDYTVSHPIVTVTRISYMGSFKK
jgi:hypothetical protein